MTRTRVCFVLAVAIGVVGCVKKSEYEALQGKQRSTQEELEATRQALAEEQARTGELNGRVSELEANLERIKGELAAGKAALERQTAQSDARVAEYRRLLDRFKGLIDAGKLKVKVVDGRMMVELPSDILFASGKVDLSEDGAAAIREIAQVLAEMTDRQFQVEGHTDNKPIRTRRFPNNWALAAGRAIAVASLMVEAGVQAKNVSAASYGESHPVGDNETDEGRTANRRIEIVLVPDFSSLPGFTELEKLGS